MTDPDRGRARTPYARSVQGKYPQPSNNLPDPGLVFDSLLKARDVRITMIVTVDDALTALRSVPKTPWRKLSLNFCLCVHCYSLSLPD